MFLPEFEDEDGEEDENGRTRKKKYRYRWPDEVRDEVLARLLKLNGQRALEEGQLPLSDLAFGNLPSGDAIKKSWKKKAARTATAASGHPLFAEQEGES
jgi:hypothetical protein